MLEKISFENFKAFKKCEIDIAPITILTGPNNGGKTTILHAIELFKQTIESSDESFLSYNGDLNFGSFDTILHQNSTQNVMRFCFHFTDKSFFDVSFLKNNNNETILNEFSCDTGDYNYRIKNPNMSINLNELILESFSANIEDQNFSTINKLFLDKKLDFFLKKFFIGFSLPADSKQLAVKIVYDVILKEIQDMKKGSKVDQIKKKRAYNLLSNILNLENTSQIYFLDLMKKFKKIKCIGPIRAIPNRLFKSGGEYDTVGYHGSNSIQMLAKNSELLLTVKDELNNLDILKDIEIINDEKDQYTQVKVKTDITNRKGVDLIDAGCGSSQILPIIVETILNDEDSLILMEQPETHLHPLVQQNFADFLIKCILKGKKKCIVETHSEYIIERIRTHVMKGNLRNDAVKIYYVEQDLESHSSKVIEIGLNEYGEYKDYPPKNYITNIAVNEINTQLGIKYDRT